MQRNRRRRLVLSGGAVIVAGLVSVALPAAAAGPTAKSAPNKNLTNGQIVNVSGKGWPKNDSLVIVECNANAKISDMNACNTNNIVAVNANAKGVVPPTQFSFATGTIGDGTCNAKQTCYIVLTEPSSTGLHALIKVTVHK